MVKPMERSSVSRYYAYLLQGEAEKTMIGELQRSAALTEETSWLLPGAPGACPQGALVAQEACEWLI